MATGVTSLERQKTATFWQGSQPEKIRASWKPYARKDHIYNVITI